MIIQTKAIPFSYRGIPHDVVAKVLDCEIEVSEFEL